MGQASGCCMALSSTFIAGQGTLPLSPLIPSQAFQNSSPSFEPVRIGSSNHLLLPLLLIRHDCELRLFHGKSPEGHPARYPPQPSFLPLPGDIECHIIRGPLAALEKEVKARLRIPKV